MTKAFLDTNIILDFLGERHPYYITTAQILTLADQKKIKIFISASSIMTAFYIVSKFDSKKNALEKIRKLKVLCEISPMNDEEVEKAINSNFKDFEDALQYFSALSAQCDVIITRNEKDFKNALIPIVDSETFLKLYTEKST